MTWLTTIRVRNVGLDGADYGLTIEGPWAYRVWHSNQYAGSIAFAHGIDSDQWVARPAAVFGQQANGDTDNIGATDTIEGAVALLHQYWLAQQ